MANGKNGLENNYKFNTLKKKQWLEAYKESKGNFSRACEAVNIERPTVYTALKENQEFKNEKEAIDNHVDDIVENRLFKMTERNVAAAIFWLTNRRPDKWQNKQDIKHMGDEEKPININIIPKKNDNGKKHRSNGTVLQE